MNRLGVLLGTSVMIAILACAQERPPTPKAELGLSYSLVNATSPGDSGQLTSNGGAGYLLYNWNHVVGLVADLGGYHNAAMHGPLEGKTTFTYLFGPRFNWRKSRVNPYVQFLFGGARLSAATNLNGTSASAAQTGFATAAGGGIDIGINRFLAVKPIQVEYVMTQIPSFSSDRIGLQNDLRYSAGVVLRFGEK